MKIKKLIIKNYKNLDLEMHNDSSVIALIGNNGSGKSNVLEALSIIFFNLYNRKEKDIPFNFELVYYIGSANNLIKIEKTNSSVKTFVDDKNTADCYNYLPKQITAIYSGEEDRLRKNFFEPFHKSFVANINKVNSSSRFESYSVLPKMLYVDKENWNISLLCLLLSNEDSNVTFCKDILGIKKINTVKFEFQSSNIENYSDSRVKDFITTINKKQEYTINELRDELELLYSWEEVYKYLYISYAIEKWRFIENIIIKYNDENLEIEDFSEGEKKMLLIKAALEFAGLEDSIFILDEPDAHIHLNNKIQIKKVFEKYDQNRQVIITTHSPTLTESLEEDSLYMLNAGKLVSEGKQQVMESISGDYWNKVQQNAFLSSKKPIILLVEGKHDKEHIINAYSALKNDYEDLDFDIFKLNSETNILPFLRGLYESDFESDKLYIGLFDREKKIINDFKNIKNYSPIEGKSFYKILENDKPNSNYFVTTLPEIEHKNCDCSIEMMFEYNKWEIAYQKAVENSIGKTKNKSIKEYSEDILKDAKNLLADNSKDFVKEDFKNFRKLFDLIREIKNLKSNNVPNEESASTQKTSENKTETNTEADIKTESKSKYYEIYTKKRNTDVIGEYHPETKKFILKTGSKLSLDTVDSFGKELSKKRKRELSKIAKSDGKFYFLERDIEFTSASGSINYATGGNMNGWDDWLLKSNNKSIQTIRKNL